MKSNRDEICEECGEGLYIETTIYDDWEHTLHCSECNHCVPSRVEEEEEEDMS